MSLQFIFTDVAIDILKSITNFIENKWGKKKADKFLEQVYKKTNLVSQNPYMYKASSIKMISE